MSGALFLDRDGTLIVDRDYLRDPDGVELLPGTTDALRRARELAYRLYLFTNQSGIGRGYFTAADVDRCNRRMKELIGLGDDLFVGECVAPEHPDQPSRYRKPSPAYILETIAADRLHPANCYMVGDKEADVLAGLNAGIAGIAVCTGKHDAAGWRQRLPAGARLFHDLAAFVATLPPVPPHA